MSFSLSESVSKLQGHRKKLQIPLSTGDLGREVQSAQDVMSDYAYDCKGAIYVMNKCLKKIGMSPIDLFESQEMAKVGIKNAEDRLKARMDELNSRPKAVSTFFINDININFVHNPTPSYSSTVITQSLVSKEIPDRLAEDIENSNLTLSALCTITNESYQSDFDKLLKIREKKEFVKVIFDEEYENMIITSISPVKDGTINQVQFNITLENVFVVSIKHTAKPIKAFRPHVRKKKKLGKQGGANFVYVSKADKVKNTIMGF